MSVWAYLAATLGVGVGACVRFSLGWLDRPKTFPWPTILANLLGSALLGAVLALSDGGALSPGATFALGTGVAGGLSTFSSLAVDALVLWRDGRRTAATAYLAGTLVLGLASAAAGFAVADALA
ncbi:CrcB family protein [Demequina sp. SYSU T00039]|uniref:Fluoride-specific ion channel FluC n=1 Tax=Demequina lignilytica TaxID=3051663 RepID=A0AAW7M9U1_9MICO|nr:MULTISPECIES: CrcB family protein [unclassified Demequina]MDN4478249.1 CrcB family protein [Demequina sp. SYSU T00039-1]MDN4488301.1 CrcB family protein [Demequina sp. SYSU T00039]